VPLWLICLQKKTTKGRSKGNKKRVSYLHRIAQPRTLAPFPAWGIQQELIVEDLPGTKIQLFLGFY
jgi:hypothetical protein